MAEYVAGKNLDCPEFCPFWSKLAPIPEKSGEPKGLIWDIWGPKGVFGWGLTPPEDTRTLVLNIRYLLHKF